MFTRLRASTSITIIQLPHPYLYTKGPVVRLPYLPLDILHNPLSHTLYTPTQHRHTQHTRIHNLAPPHRPADLSALLFPRRLTLEQGVAHSGHKITTVLRILLLPVQLRVYQIHERQRRPPSSKGPPAPFQGRHLLKGKRMGNLYEILVIILSYSRHGIQC